MKTYSIFLDTNIYDAFNYSFDNPQFSKVRQFVSDGNISLLINSIIEGEVRSHIKKRIGDALTKTNNSLKDSAFAAFRNEPSYSSRFEPFDISELPEFIDKKFTNYLEVCKVQRISVNGIDIESIISDYFNEVPPFEAKKPEEFKDAIAAKSITQYCHNHEKDTVVCVITKDKGFAKTFDGEPIQLYNDLNTFLDMMTTLLDNRTRALRSFIDSGNADKEIYYNIKRHIERIEFFSAEITDDFEIIDISHINFKTLYIHSLDPASAVIEIEISAIIKSWSNTIDEDRSYFDKEEWQYLWKLEFEKEETHKIEVDAEIVLDISAFADHPEPEEDWDFSDDVVTVDEINGFPGQFILDEETCINVDILTDPYQEDKDELDFRYATCPDCGDTIYFDNDGGNGF